MKKIALTGCLLIFFVLQLCAQSKKVNQQLLRHIVMFSFKQGSTDEQVKAVTDAFAALPKKIKQIKTFEWGVNNSPESLNEGFTHCFFVTFTSEKDRAIYLPHPDHVAFGNILKPILDKVLVIDYWTKK
jgi:hypothetical protein